MSLRVLVVDDHPLYREGLVAAIATMPEVEVVGTAAEGGEAVRGVQAGSRRGGDGPAHAGHERHLVLLAEPDDPWARRRRPLPPRGHPADRRRTAPERRAGTHHAGRRRLGVRRHASRGTRISAQGSRSQRDPAGAGHDLTRGVVFSPGHRHQGAGLLRGRRSGVRDPVSRPNRAGTRDSRPGSPRADQHRDSRTAGALTEDSPEPCQQRVHQAASGEPRRAVAQARDAGLGGIRR